MTAGRVPAAAVAAVRGAEAANLVRGLLRLTQVEASGGAAAFVAKTLQGAMIAVMVKSKEGGVTVDVRAPDDGLASALAAEVNALG
jgi:hypothetical protein